MKTAQWLARIFLNFANSSFPLHNFFNSHFYLMFLYRYYNGCLLFNIQQNYIFQTGDPTGTGKGGSSVFEKIKGPSHRFFPSEIHPHLKHTKFGMVSMASHGPDQNGSQFLITLRDIDLSHLDEHHTIFGQVVEGDEVLHKINGTFVDEEGRPYQDIRILHTHILDDPFEEKDSDIYSSILNPPPPSPLSIKPDEEMVDERTPYSEDPSKSNNGVDPQTEAEMDEMLAKREAESRAVVLEMAGDIPDAHIKPADNVLFVCKLNPCTTEADLEIIFSRFGKVKMAEIIKDEKTGEGLNFAFIEFDTEESCAEAYLKMNNVLIDDRRIKIDFSQSVAKEWNKYTLQPRNFGSSSSHNHNNNHDKGERGQGGGGQIHKTSSSFHKQHHSKERDDSSRRPRDEGRRKRERRDSQDYHHSHSSKHKKKKKNKRRRRSRS